jgi:hypothetical protein
MMKGRRRTEDTGRKIQEGKEGRCSKGDTGSKKRKKEGRKTFEGLEQAVGVVVFTKQGRKEGRKVNKGRKEGKQGRKEGR